MTKKSSRTRPPSPPPVAPPEPMDQGRFLIAGCVLIAATAFIAFLPTLNNGFTNWDDDVYITANPDIRHIDATSVAKLFSSVYSANYQPVTMLVYALEYGCFGLDPAGYHWFNLLVHIANCLLVLLLIFRLSGSSIAAFVTSLLFAVHPLHAESVAWLAECKDVVATFFYLLSLLFYLRFTGKNARSAYFLSLVMLILSLLSKPTAVSLPLILLLIDYYSAGKIGWPQVRAKLPFFVLAGIFCVVTIATQKHVDVVRSIPTVTILQKIGLPFYGLAFYLLKTAVPVHLCALYSFPPVITAGMDVKFALSAVAVLVLAALLYRYRNKSATLWFGSLFFLVTLLPMLGIIQVGNAMVAERYTYIPLIGIFFICGIALAKLAQKKNGANHPALPLIVVAFAVPVAVFMCLTFERCYVWHDSLTLWTDIIDKSPSAMAYYNRGTTFIRLKRLDRAVEDLTNAIADCPALALAYSNRGAANYLMRHYEPAIADFNAALALTPGDAEIRRNRDHAVKVFGEVMAASAKQR